MKRYILLAGVNGAGKSTLFSLLSSLGEIEKVNLDETVKKLGDWRDNEVVLRAGRIVVKQIEDFFEQGISFSQETTLCGKSILRNIMKAKKLGYHVEMHYVGLDSVKIAKERVRKRVGQGGHGISDEDIERRYSETLLNLRIILPQCDLAVIYDNTEIFQRFAIFKNGKCVRLSKHVPTWYRDAMDL